MQQINKFQWNRAHYETRNIRFLKYISQNSLYHVRKCCATSDITVLFLVNSNGKITTNCVKYIKFRVSYVGSHVSQR